MSTSPSTNTAARPCSVSSCSEPVTHCHDTRSASGRTRTIPTCSAHRADARAAAAYMGLIVTRVTRVNVILDAAALLRAQGWHQGAYYPGWTDELDSPNRSEAAELINEQGLPACVVGALVACGAEAPEIDAVVRQLLPSQVTQWPNSEGILSDWQDAQGRTLDEVLDVLDRAAKAVAA